MGRVRAAVILQQGNEKVYTALSSSGIRKTEKRGGAPKRVLIGHINIFRYLLVNFPCNGAKVFPMEEKSITPNPHEDAQ